MTMISVSVRSQCVLYTRRHLLLQQLKQQQSRWKSSSAWIADFPVPKAIRQAVKSSFLNEASKADSKLWSDNNHNNNNHNNNNNNHKTPNGLYNHSHNHHHHHNHVNGVTKEDGSIHNATTPNLDDPLDEWYLDHKPTYWPNLPPGVVVQEDADPFALSKTEIDSLAQTIRQDLLGTEHPVLNQAASYFFQPDDAGGKKVRPTMVLLLSRALADHVGAGTPATTTTTTTPDTTTTAPSSIWSEPLSWQRSDLPQSQRRLAEISELIHTASLFHDDVIDEAETRRGKASVHQIFGNKMAILAGDYLLARASISLARLRQVDVVECMSTIIEHLVRGEVMQMKGTSSSLSNNNDSSEESRLVYYLRKNYFKTGSLMANSCRSTALLGNYSADLVDCAYRYGKHIGMAFQLVDDVLDFEGSTATMGKPALADLKAGLATAPVLYALQSSSTTTSLIDNNNNSSSSSSSSNSILQLQTMMDRKFRHEGDVERTVEFVLASDGIRKTKELAQVHAELAMKAVLPLKPSEYRDALIHLAYKVVDRTH